MSVHSCGFSGLAARKSGRVTSANFALVRICCLFVVFAVRISACCSLPLASSKQRTHPGRICVSSRYRCYAVCPQAKICIIMRMLPSNSSPLTPGLHSSTSNTDSTSYLAHKVRNALQGMRHTSTYARLPALPCRHSAQCPSKPAVALSLPLTVTLTVTLTMTLCRCRCRCLCLCGRVCSWCPQGAPVRLVRQIQRAGPGIVGPVPGRPLRLVRPEVYPENCVHGCYSAHHAPRIRPF